GLGNQFHNQGSTADLDRSSARELSYRADAAWTPRPSLMVPVGTYLQGQRETMTSTRFLETRAGTSQAHRTESADGSASLHAGEARLVWTAPERLSVDGGGGSAPSALTGQTMGEPGVRATWWMNRSWSIRAGGALADQVPQFAQVIGTFGNRHAQVEHARHLDAAIEHRPSPNVRWQVAVYDRRERDVLRLENSETRVVGRNVVFASSLTPSWQNALAGTARGVEVML